MNLKKICIVSLNICTLFLILFTIMILNIFHEAKGLDDDTDYQFKFSPEIITKLNVLYIKTGDFEFAGCLIGKQINDTIYIEDLDSFKKGKNTSVNRGTFCMSRKYVGIIHKHTTKPTIWYPSYPDLIENYIQFILFNKLSIIMYDIDEITIMTPKNWRMGVKYSLQELDIVEV